MKLNPTAIARFVARVVGAPGRVPYRQPLEVVWLVVALGILLLLVFFALPPVVDAVVGDTFLPSLHAMLVQNRIWLDRWSAFLKLLFEVLTAVAIGGSIFAQSAAASIKQRLQQIEAKLLQDVHSVLTANERQIYRHLRKSNYLIVTATWKNIWRRIPRLATISYDLHRFAAFDIPWSYWRFITVAMPASFPGGFYGVLAFIFLTMLCAVKVVQIYLPRIPIGL